MTEQSFEQIVADRAPALLRLAVMLTGNLADAEDVLQTALSSAVPHARRIETMAAPAAYLRRAVVNAHLGAGRRQSRRPRTISFESVPALDPPSDLGRMPSGTGAMWQHLASLNLAQRATLVLRYYEDLPDAEIANLLGCAEATVRSHAHRGLATLRERLHDLDPEEL